MRWLQVVSILPVDGSKTIVPVIMIFKKKNYLDVFLETCILELLFNTRCYNLVVSALSTAINIL